MSWRCTKVGVLQYTVMYDVDVILYKVNTVTRFDDFNC